MITDYIVAGFFFYFFLTGWMKGFLRTLLGPISLVAGCLIGYVYYQKYHDLMGSLGICVLGPFLINIAASILLKVYHKTVDDGKTISPLSRFLGGSFNALWGGSYLVALIIMTGLVPIQISWFDRIQDNVTSSKTYTFLNQWISAKTPSTSVEIDAIKTLLNDPSQMKKFESTPEFQSIAEDPFIRDLINDEEIAKLIRARDYAKLLSHPKMRELLKNEDLLKKIFALNMAILEKKSSHGSEGLPSEPPPRMIDVK